MKAGIVEVYKLGENYRLVRDEVKDCYEFIYRDDRGNLKRNAYRYVVNARGQEKSMATNPSTLARNLLKSGTVQIEEIRPVDQSTLSSRLLWITDNRVIQPYEYSYQSRVTSGERCQ